MQRTIWMAMLALVVALPTYAGAEPAEPEVEYMRLRPLKQPTACAGAANAGANCPLVSAPQINKRRSTIPGIKYPDRGRPPVIVVPPPSKRATPGFRTFGGNRGIFGG